MHLLTPLSLQFLKFILRHISSDLPSDGLLSAVANALISIGSLFKASKRSSRVAMIKRMYIDPGRDVNHMPNSHQQTCTCRCQLNEPYPCTLPSAQGIVGWCENATVSTYLFDILSPAILVQYKSNLPYL